MPDRELLRQFDKETLIDMLEDSSKNWLAPPDPHPDEFWCAWEFTVSE